MDAVRKLLPESNRLLERFSESRRRLIANLGSEARTSLAYQKEAVATALTLAGIERQELQDWRPRPKNGRVQSFLDGLSEASLREDQMVINDLGTFPGFKTVRQTPHTTAVFENDRIHLTVVMANRLPLEKQLGADLIYCNETYRSFVIVQYKAMERETGTARFRLPNGQLEKELKRMEKLWAEFQGCPPDASLKGFRLKENPFFLKLCPRIVFDPDDAGLIKGMYLPLEYWRRLERDPGVKGSRDGKVVTFDNAGRHFDNTAFAHLVASGWIGTTAPQTAVLKAVIREIIKTGRTVTIAVKRDLKPTPSGRDRRLLDQEPQGDDERPRNRPVAVLPPTHRPGIHTQALGQLLNREPEREPGGAKLSRGHPAASPSLASVHPSVAAADRRRARAASAAGAAPR